MQNIPGIILDKTSEQISSASYAKVNRSEQQLLFSELFDKHANRIENELALKPVSTSDDMLDVAPETTALPKNDVKHTSSEHKDNKDKVLKAANEEEIKEEKAYGRDRDKRMTQEDLDEVRDDLEGYGFSEEEIAEIEEEINSEEGMTWGQFVSTVAQKMADLRKITLSDEQKENLSSFFAKLGFTSKESDKLIKQLENGNQKEVMAAIAKKLDALPEGQQLLFTKDEVEAFSAAMNFSKEFTSQLKEQFAKNMLPKELKEAFTQIRQELADMDEKDQELVRAVGRQFLKAMGKEVKESTAARDVKEAVDLKPRVAEENATGETPEEVKEDFKEAVDNRKDSLPGNTARKSDHKVVPQQAESHTNDQAETDGDDHWNNFFNKLRAGDPKNPGEGQPFQAKTETIESMLKTGLSEASSKTDTRTWEKVSAPKVMRQVENAFIKTLQNGSKQLTLQLTPENLGKLSVMLQVQGKDVKATIRAENHDAARLIADNIDTIKNSLESQGLKVDKLEVQTGLTGDMNQNDWFGAEEHNLAREREAMVAMRKHMRDMREGDGVLAQEMQSNIKSATVADQGLHIIA